ncbi:hypothetical protein SCHPADRAFT_935224 [Schizopora paradoxa]|uniref:Phospholipid/glycerol acyltransferase domain-containing protein n=1 Tax=Schizopora paradoxa TaxID=27342 RepID=A0A0H2S5D3_9AGAM|nr:hypothetical protein SCHPADRAFT_935224 [Schizopora paradoxa]
MSFQRRRAPLVHSIVRLLFQILVKVFFKTLVVEGAEFVPPEGNPCLVCSNHGNSITDAVMVVGSTPNRNMVRLTAKSTLFGRRTITTFIMESAGAVPIMRKKDYAEGAKIDNVNSMEVIKQVLEQGDAVCFFPEGGSRFHPTLAPLKSGVAWLVSDTLSKRKNDPDFTLNISMCSINYIHRQRFRSDVIATYHPPIVLTPKTYPKLCDPSTAPGAVRELTAEMYRKLRAGLIDAPSWDIIHVASFAARLYLSETSSFTFRTNRYRPDEYVKIWREFTNLFSEAYQDAHTQSHQPPLDTEEIQGLIAEIKTFCDELTSLGLVRSPYSPGDDLPDLFPKKNPFDILLYIILPLLLTPIAIPGFVTFWGPTFLLAHLASKTFLRNALAKEGGTIEDTYDEIAHMKIVTGLVCGLLGASALLCIALFMILVMGASLWAVGMVLVGVPAAQWVSFRIMEEGWIAFDVLRGWVRIRALGEPKAAVLREREEGLRRRVLELFSSVA